MPSRREFLAISLASPAVPIAASETHDGIPDFEHSIPCGAVIVEATSPLALGFRAEAINLGLAVHDIHDDITDLWYHFLDRQWRTTPGALAGVTLSTSLFCLETFARDYGMRVWFRADHETRPDGRIHSVFSGNEKLVEQAAAMGGAWPEAFARFATAVPFGKPGKSEQSVEHAATFPQEEPGPMVSWIIAPRRRNPPRLSS